MTKEIVWLQYFNPCGAMVVEGYGNKRCVSKNCGRFPCLQRASYIAAEAILGGSDTRTEKQELTDYLGGLVGKPIVDLDGNTIQVKNEQLGQISDQVVAQANRFIDGVESCIRNTEPVGPETMSNQPSEEQQILGEIYELNQQARRFKGNQADARKLASEIQAKLSEALDFGLGRIDLIARQALGYGLADRLPFIDATGLIFLGDPLNITPSK